MFTFLIYIDGVLEDSEIYYLQIALDIATNIKKQFPEKSIKIVKKGSDGKELIMFDL